MAAAAERTRSLALTAGPGAGKTEMLAQRADFLLRTGTCRYPRRILAISFKVDSSRNLKERVRRRCGLTLASRFDSHSRPEWMWGNRGKTKDAMFLDSVPIGTISLLCGHKSVSTTQIYIKKRLRNPILSNERVLERIDAVA